MRVTNALLVARAKALRENFVIVAIVLHEDDYKELATEQANYNLAIFLGMPIIRHDEKLPPAVAVST